MRPVAVSCPKVPHCTLDSPSSGKIMKRQGGSRVRETKFQSKHPEYKVVIRSGSKSLIAELRNWWRVSCDPYRCSHLRKPKSCKFLCHSTQSVPATKEKQVFAGSFVECEMFVKAYDEGRTMTRSDLRLWLNGNDASKKSAKFAGNQAALRYGVMPAKLWNETDDDFKGAPPPPSFCPFSSSGSNDTVTPEQLCFGALTVSGPFC